MRERIEQFTGKSFVIKTIEAQWNYLPEEIELPFPDHDEITEVKINGDVSEDYAENGMTKLTVKPYTVHNVGTGIDTPESLYVKYTTTGECPEAVKNEMLRLIDEKYRNRGNTFVGTTNELNENSFANLAQFCEM